MKIRTQKRAADRLKTLQECRDWLLTHKKSDSRTSTIRYIDILIGDVTNANENILILKLTKQDFLNWELFKRYWKQFKKWLDEGKSNVSIPKIKSVLIKKR